MIESIKGSTCGDIEKTMHGHIGATKTLELYHCRLPEVRRVQVSERIVKTYDTCLL